MTRLAVISGGLRQPSSTRMLADRLTAAVESELRERDVTVSTSVIELRPLARSITDAMLTGLAAAELEAAFTTIGDADGVIAVTPAFNASISGLFKSFFDVLPQETLSEMPVLIGATGGTERHSLVLEHAMRPMFSYLHAIVSPTGVYAATADFGEHRQAADLAARIAKAASDFARLLQACGIRTRRDVFTEELTEMQRLLGESQPHGDGTVED
ncbi:FMN reductase [Mycolicibacterium litorale]|uniref:FMN reductase n=1 Tax=Mycolicibacterium litorale TaxID=758802 RepID=A0A6S6NZF4_9MYCO|nr:CE1759 family FMN reductase [Mycolicibacterium litorale]BCI51559.1 FMN reductase [Mycolicibacterium litorale]